MKSLKNFLDAEGRLAQMPVRRAMQQEALEYLAEKFQPGVEYTEKEVNELLNRWHTFRDPATLRRALYDHRFLESVLKPEKCRIFDQKRGISRKKPQERLTPFEDF